MSADSPNHLLTAAGLLLRVRPMTPCDLEQVQAIEARVHSHPWRPSYFADCLKAGYFAYVAEHAEDPPSRGRIVAYALASAGGGQADLLNIAVAPELRRQGIADSLLSFLIERLRGRVESLFLEVRASNRAAINLYEKLGFNQVGMRPNYYPARGGGREDALILVVDL